MAFIISRCGLIFVFVFSFLMTPLISMVSCSCGLSLNIFKTEPTNTIVKEGDFVNFTCAVQNSYSLNDFIIWNVSPELANYNVTERYDTQSNDMTSVLTVHAMRNLQLFSCDVHSSKNWLCLSSRTASMKVEYFPREEDLSCGSNGPQVLQVGDVMPAYCQVPRGNPGVDMSWRFFPELPPVSLPLARDESARRILSYDLPISLQMHMKTIVCEVTSEIVFPDRYLQCSIGPILVLQAPKVLIRPNDAVIAYDRSVELTCTPDGYPNTFNFSWSCLPESVVTGCDSKSETATIAINRNFHMDAESSVAEITCTASNYQGTSTGYLNADIIFDPKEQLATTISTPVFCRGEFEPIISVLFRNKTRFGKSNSSFMASCEVRNVTRKTHIQMLWRLGKGELMEGITNFSSSYASSFFSHLSLHDLSEENYNKSIECVVNICNTTRIASLPMLKGFDKENASEIVDLSSAYDRAISTNTPSILDVVHEDLETSPLHGSAYPTASSLEYQFPATSVLGDTVQSSTFRQTSPSKPTLKWQVITISVVGVIGVVVTISCLVSLISVIMYKHIKKENQRSINNFIRELSTSHSVCTNDLNLDEDHVYEVPRLGTILKSHDPIVSDDNTNINQECSFYTLCESSDNSSSCTSTSATSSWSNSSGIYLTPDFDNVPLEKTQHNNQEAFCSNVYANERIVRPPAQRKVLSYKPKGLKTFPHAKGTFDIPMPAYPSKIEKE